MFCWFGRQIQIPHSYWTDIIRHPDYLHLLPRQFKKSWERFVHTQQIKQINSETSMLMSDPLHFVCLQNINNRTLFCQVKYQLSFSSINDLMLLIRQILVRRQRKYQFISHFLPLKRKTRSKFSSIFKIRSKFTGVHSLLEIICRPFQRELLFYAT